MITLENNLLTAKFNQKGAELKSLIFNGREYIWRGDEKIWGASAPILFPICSALKENTYFYGGEAYKIGMHGFAVNSEFAVESKTDFSVTFLLASNAESKKIYPFDYELRITYELIQNRLSVAYSVKNSGSCPMYFSIGAHEGYYCPDGAEKYDVIFPVKQDLYSCTTAGGLLTDKKIKIADYTDVLPVRYDYFKNEALIFDDLKSNTAVLKNRESGRGIKLSFEGFDYFLIWSLPNAPFICLEPWCGISDTTDTTQQLTEKKGINRIEPNTSFSKTHIIEFF